VAIRPQIVRQADRVGTAWPRLGMPIIRDFDRPKLAAILDRQSGVLSRSQALSHGMSVDQIRSRLASGVWRATELAGVYLTFTGPTSDLARCWVALLYAGDGAVLCRDSAAWSWRLRDELVSPVHVLLPPSRRVVSKMPLVAIHYSIHHVTRCHPAHDPPVTRLEDTVLDSVDFAERPAEVIDVVTRACQRRLTSPARLSANAVMRKKLGHRELLTDVLCEVMTGVQSALERVYLRDVERAHGLPRGERNAAEGDAARRRYRDVRYRKYGLIVELDGKAAHPVELRDRDDLRDNEVVEVEGSATLRYGWTAVSDRACETAAQVSRLLHSGGWRGPALPCGPGCPIAGSSAR
jgi:hypothetical protein